MKRISLLVLLTLIAFNLVAYRGWDIHTNTTHIYDLLEQDDKIFLATWGGLEVFNLNTKSFEKTYTTSDGLEDLDIRAISFLESSETLLLGTAAAGINRLKNDRFLMAVNQTIGLPDNKINVIVSSDSLIYVGTNQGLTVFKDLVTFPYPLPINHYATHNGLVSNQVTSLVLTDDGHLICGTNNGFSYVALNSMFDLNSWQNFRLNNSPLPDSRITALSASGSSFAVSTRAGLVRIRDINDFSEWDVFTQETHPEIIKSNNIFTAFMDNSQNIWFSYGVWNDEILFIEETINQAVVKIAPDDSFVNWNKNEAGLATSSIKGFKEINGNIYLYTWGEGLFYLDSSDWWVNYQSNSIIASNITDIAVDNNHTVWFSNGYIGGGINRKGTRGVSGFDGFTWRNYSQANSPLRNNRIFRVAVDRQNRKWFGGWGGGISVFDEVADRWYYFNNNNGLPVNEIGAITTDKEGYIWISNNDGGLIILESEAVTAQGNIPIFHSFQLFQPNVPFSDVLHIHHTEDKVFFGSRYSGVRYWDSADTFPETEGAHWRKPPVRDLTDGYVYIYAIDSRKTHWGEEIWIAAESGLFMFDTSNDNWYRYGTSIKREVWQSNQWQRNRLYFIDEERLYGAAPTFPTALFVDPFDRIWIGTETNGITIYNLNTDRYSILNTENSPLISNKITKLSYEPASGTLYIGTDEGLNTLLIGSVTKTSDRKLSSTVVYPNPFYPDRHQHLVIANMNDEIMPQGKNECRIYSIDGELIITLEEDRFFKFSWDGRNSAGKKSSSGVYYYVIGNESGDTDRGTIVLVR